LHLLTDAAWKGRAARWLSHFLLEEVQLFGVFLFHEGIDGHVSLLLGLFGEVGWPAYKNNDTPSTELRQDVFEVIFK
jgi:hypothetical protein